MKKNIKNQFGASLLALAFSLGASLPAAAQTCVPPPSCDTLGFTKTVADCTGKTILKCPFDTGKVYCPGAEELGDNPFVSTWKVGSSVVYNGKEVGTILEDKGASVVIYDQGLYDPEWTKSGSFDYCRTKVGVAGYQWKLTTVDEIEKLVLAIPKKNIIYEKYNDGDYIYSAYNQGFIDSFGDRIKYDNSWGDIGGYVYCINTIPAPVNR